MEGFWRKAIAASCILALVASCSSKKDVPTKPEHAQTVGNNGKNLMFPAGVNVTVPQGAVTTDSRLAVTDPAAESLPVQGATKAAVRFDVSLEQNGKNDIQPSKPLMATINLTGAWLPNGAKPQDAKVYTPIEGRLWLVPSQVVGTKLTMSLGHLSPKYITYVSDEDLLKSFDAERVKKNPGSCAQQIAVPGGKVKFGPDSRGWSTKSDSPILACLYQGIDGYVRVGILNRVPYVLSVSTDSDVRMDAATGNADAELIKYVTGKLFPGTNTKGLVAEGDKAVGSIKIDNLPSEIRVDAGLQTFFADVIIRDTQLLIDFLKASPTPAGELTDLLDKMLGSSNVVSCFQDLFKGAGKNPDLGSLSWGGSKCLIEPMIDYITDKFGLGNLWSAIKFVKDGLSNFFTAAKYAWTKVFAINSTVKVSVVAEVKPQFAGKLILQGLQIPTLKNWEVEVNDGGLWGTALDTNTCTHIHEGDNWKNCAQFYVFLNKPGTSSIAAAYQLESMKGICPGLSLVERGAKVGGKSADIYKLAGCIDFEIAPLDYLWNIPGYGTIEVKSAFPQPVMMKGMREAFAAATWN